MPPIDARRASLLVDDLTDEALLTPGEVATLFRVSPKTVTHWARAGKLTAMKTLGGHRRFRAGEVRTALASAQHQR